MDTQVTMQAKAAFANNNFRQVWKLLKDVTYTSPDPELIKLDLAEMWLFTLYFLPNKKAELLKALNVLILIYPDSWVVNYFLWIHYQTNRLSNAQKYYQATCLQLGEGANFPDTPQKAYEFWCVKNILHNRESANLAEPRVKSLAS